MTNSLDPNRRAAIRDHAIRALLDLPQTIGRYTVRGELGRGGMGVVYHAYDPQLERDVAVKVINPALLASTDASIRPEERFEREMRAASPIFHPNVVTILDAGTASLAEEGPASRVAYYVMERVIGESLEDRIRRTGPLPRTEALSVAIAVAKGLTALHERGLVHRDVKPSNILLPIGQGPKLTDFGLIHLIDDPSRQGEESVIEGSTHGLAPEQIGSGAVDERSDLFALGAVIIRMWTGDEPFAASSLRDRLIRIRTAQPDGIERLPPDVARLVRALLEKAPEHRPRSAADVAAELVKMKRARRPGLAGYALRTLAVAGMLGALYLGAAQWEKSRLEDELAREHLHHEAKIAAQLERATLLAGPLLSISELQALPADERRAINDRVEGIANRVALLRNQHEARVEALEGSARIPGLSLFGRELTSQSDTGMPDAARRTASLHDPTGHLVREEREQLLQQIELLEREFDVQAEVHLGSIPDAEAPLVPQSATKERRLRIVLDLNQEFGSIECSQALEPALSDALLGALLREQILPLAHRDQTAFGLRLAIRVIRESLRSDLARARADDAPALVRASSNDYAGGGARATRTPEVESFFTPLTPDQRRGLAAAATPELTWARFIEWMKLETADVDVTLFTPQSREILREWPASRPYWRSVLRSALQAPLETIETEDRALLFSRAAPEVAPRFFARSEVGWQLDLAAGRAHILTLAGGSHRWSFHDIEGDPLVPFREELTVTNGLIRLADN